MPLSNSSFMFQVLEQVGFQVLEHSPDLPVLYALKPVEEVLDGGAGLQVGEQVGEGHPGIRKLRNSLFAVLPLWWRVHAAAAGPSEGGYSLLRRRAVKPACSKWWSKARASWIWRVP